jgi:hypothetical protein
MYESLHDVSYICPVINSSEVARLPFAERCNNLNYINYNGLLQAEFLQGIHHLLLIKIMVHCNAFSALVGYDNKCLVLAIMDNNVC